MSEKYASAGVNLEAGYESVERIKKHAKQTHNKGVMSAIGGFGGLFDLGQYGYKDPILVSGTDGVGTKLQLAIDWNMHTTIGIDLVAMCVNDILAQGAKPLFFLDYLAVGKNVPSRIEEIVAGVSQGCIQSDAALIGGETAEMPGMYAEDSYDLAGFAVGIAERHELIDVNNVKVGDAIIGLASTGIHSNGYSLVRKILSDSQIEITEELKAMVMEPTKIYVKEVLELMKRVKVHAAVHNTGGGFIENLPRALAAGLGANIKLGSWDIPEVFEILKEAGQMDTIEMMNVFNMGIGFMLIVSPEDKEEVMNILGDQAFEIGQVVSGEGVSFV
ncbi:MAG TPA: phosphoribosylformylglycinamidine cyclo-ligase [Erysipelothrix sp.]|nr:phosphoribosylformylglycinamidine cyclo-ligase [Erysipelothrix sp.]